jgi:hypothetical protein
MKQLLTTFICLFWLVVGVKAQEVLIVADEIPAMEVLANALKTQEHINAKIIRQTELPNSLTAFRAVVVYIHKDLDSIPEKAFINYAENGGKLICLHHSISSAKRKNAAWFPFLGIELPKKDVREGGYKYIGSINMDVVNLAPNHFITTHKIRYESTIDYTREGQQPEKKLPGFRLSNTEAFVNHNLLTPRTILLGFKLVDDTGNVWMQDRSAWCMPVGKGWLFYSQPGHAVSDFENPIYARIVMNAVIYTP